MMTVSVESFSFPSPGGDRASATAALSIAGSSRVEGGLMPERVAGGDAGVAGWISAELQQNVIEPIAYFQKPDQEWRRLFSEFLGTFFLVTVAGGGGMMGAAFPNTIGR